MLRFRQRGNSQVTGLAAPVSAQSRHTLLPLSLLCLDVAPSRESRDLIIKEKKNLMIKHFLFNYKLCSHSVLEFYYLIIKKETSQKTLKVMKIKLDLAIQ